MGNTRGYIKQSSVTPEQASTANYFLNKAKENVGWTGDYFKQMATGGPAYQALADSVLQNYTRQGLPSTLGALGSNAQGSSALNQALAAGQSDLSTSLGSILSELGMKAATQASQQGMNAGQQGLGTSFFQNTQGPAPAWAQILSLLADKGLDIGTRPLQGLGGSGQVGSILGSLLAKTGLFR